jgi:hypothetical protein
MLRFVIRALTGALLFSACTNSTIRSQEGHACSTNSSDDPQLVCTPAQDLVCIATYTRTVTNPNEAGKFDGGIRQVYVCRIACNVTAECPQPGDICCRGNIFGKTYDKMGGCVPPSSCESEGEDVDAGAPDGAAMAGPDAAGDTKAAADGAGAGETGAMPDAGQDAAEADSAAEAGAPDAPVNPTADGGTTD